MAKKDKRISVNAFERVMKKDFENTEVFDWHGVEVTVRRTIPFREVLEFVGSAAESCFTSDTGDYVPEAKDFAIYSNVLERYANFTMPEKLDAQYELIYGTDAFEAVREHIDQAQLNSICRAIDEKVRYRTQTNIEAVQKQFDELSAVCERIQERLSETFNGVNKEDIHALLRALGERGFDEEKLVRAYTDIYFPDKEETDGEN